MTIHEVTPAMLNEAVAETCRKFKEDDGTRTGFVNRCQDSSEIYEYVGLLTPKIFRRKPPFEDFAQAAAVLLTALAIGIETGLELAEKEARQ